MASLILGAGLAGAAGAASGALLWAHGRRGRGPAVLTPHDCARALRRLGWTFAGAGPNEWCIYANKGPHRIVLTTTLADPVTELAVSGLASSFREAEFAAGRRAVAVHLGALSPALAEEAAAQDLTLVHVSKLDALETALEHTDTIAASGRERELQAKVRAYDPPSPSPLLARAAEEAVLETERVACFIEDRGGDRLLIGFANQWFSRDGRDFWARAQCRALGLSAVGFVANGPNWYPADDMATLLPLLQARLAGRFPVRIAAGHSQGGHAAIRYASALGAEAVLALSPQFTIDGRLLRDERVNRHYVGSLHAGMDGLADNPAERVMLFYDPYDAADAAHAAAIAGAVPTDLVPMPFAGHATDRGLADPARLAALIEFCLSCNTAGAQQLVAGMRRTRPQRALQMALAVAARHPGLAAGILETHTASWSPEQISDVCYRIAKAGSAERVISAVRNAAAAAPGSAHVQGTAALVALEARRFDEAQTHIEAALQLDALNAKWRDVKRRTENLIAGALARAQ